MKDLESRLEAEALAGPVVELANKAGEFRGCDLCQVAAFGQILAQEAVGVFVGAPLPGVVRMGEVDGQIQLLFQLQGSSILVAVVERGKNGVTS
jgi:hypothetical protein